VTPAILNLHRHYDDSLSIIVGLLSETNTDYAPWHIVGATDPDYAVEKVCSTLVKTLEKTIQDGRKERSDKEKHAAIEKPKKNPVKRRSIPETSCTKEECIEELCNLQIERLDLQSLLYKRAIPLIIIYEGWDAAGKGGNITRISRFMNPLGYDVIPIAAPSASEKEHHYHRRFIQPLPKAGHVAINDRSWYGRVLIERGEGQCTKAEWQRAYREIHEMEAEYIMSSGGGVVKFWLEISKDEQLRRFEQLKADPRKTYKITDDDGRNREKWDLYDEAIDEMLARTNTRIAPWTVIESDDKLYARVKALRTVTDCVRKLL
jgi:polyphosphate kinase 2 (PPK2 family)